SLEFLLFRVSTLRGLYHRAGIRGIWNFTNRDLNLRDENVVVEDVHFGDSLLTLSYLIAHEGQD
ncbi:MAG: hypothetical protein LUD79_00790, partial [Oscillospiraceae bacterium]|nr:hypothetical protein [Oscillospiraceae bacterium]